MITSIAYEQSLFFLGPSRKHVRHANDHTRDWRCETRKASFLASREPSRARSLPSLNLKKKRDCSQSISSTALVMNQMNVQRPVRFSFISDFCNNHSHPPRPCIWRPRIPVFYVRRPCPTRPCVPCLMSPSQWSRVPKSQVPTHASRCPRPTFIHSRCHKNLLSLNFQ